MGNGDSTMSLNLLKNRFCIYGESFHKTEGFEGYELNKGIYSLIKKRSFRGKYIFMTGAIYNIDIIKGKFQIEGDDTEEIILQLYDNLGMRVASFLEGTYSIIIVDKTRILAFRDRFSVENLYYYRNKKLGSFIFANSLLDLKKFIKFELNVDVLPKYFLCSQINGKNTFVKDVFTLEHLEFLTCDVFSSEWQSSKYEDLPYQSITMTNVDDKTIIDEADHLISNALERVCGHQENFKFINSFSGGVDSSLIQVILKRLGFNSCYTACYSSPFGDKVEKNSSEIANYLNSEHRLVKISPSEILQNIKDGIGHTELPYIYQGEWLQNPMYRAISIEVSEPGKGIVVVDGNGADNVFGSGQGLLLLKYLSNFWIYHIFNYFNEHILKHISKENYEHYQVILSGISSDNINPQFILVLFGEDREAGLIQEAFHLKDISDIFDFEKEEFKKYSGSLIERFNRIKIFEYEIIRENNITYQLMKAHDIIGFYPYIDLNFVRYLLQVPTRRKIRSLTFKYFQKKIASKYLPKEFVYRKKYGDLPDRCNLFPGVFKDEKTFISIIDEIKKAEYNYFDFDLDMIFGKKEFESLAIKLINFHIWHKMYIKDER